METDIFAIVNYSVIIGHFAEIESEVRLLGANLSTMHQKAVKLDEKVRGLTELKRYLSPLGQQTDIRLRDSSFSGDYLFP